MNNYNSFIELLKKFEFERNSNSEDEFDNDDTGLYNGFSCDRFEDIEVYKNHLKDLFKIAFIDIKKAVDGLLINSNNPSLLDIFFQSKIDDLTEIEKIIEERDDKITEDKINNSALYREAKEKFEKEGGDNYDELLLESLENWWRWKRYEELFYRGEMDMFELAEAGVPLKDRMGVRFFARIVMEKEQRDMIKSTKDRMNELYGIYCPKQNEVKEEKISKSIKSQVERDFRSYLHHDNKDALMEKLHELLDNEKGKVVAITIKALENLGFISVLSQRAALYKCMEEEFGKIGAYQGLNKFYNDLSNEKLMLQQLKQELQHQIDVLSKVR
ncbi:hypothetical protein IR083_21320 [Dysgonomonas sp. GY75]|uniref:hypothetical protein n=1 Tax=Dysgonomonas sp. GY75 TaxID=2780419 RepID=UPI00188363CF|nr:hypothetical protein [Dysgonomonas sp. GY75]MBF0651360.1 hypothetical protein [Dysgonomonas sp. GY75]